MRVRARHLTAAALGFVLAAAPPAGADTLLSVEPAAPKLTAYHGTAAWSTYDAAAGAWFLVTRTGGVLERALVPPRSVPFDVDLGTDGSGRVVAAYSRCERDPAVAEPAGRGCDLYAYDLYSRRERRLSGPSTAGASEYMPSLADGRVAFGRVRRGRTELYAGPLRGPARLVPGGRQNRDRRTGLNGLDLEGDQLAIAWRTVGPAGQALPYGAAELRVDDLRRGTQTLVTRLANSNLNHGSVFTPALTGRWVRYGLTWVTEGETVITAEQTYDLRQGFRSSLPLPDRLAGVAETGAGETYLVTCEPDDGACSVAAIEASPPGPDPDAGLASLERTTPLSWAGRWAAYSEYDGSLPGYRLTLRSSEGRLVRPDVPARAAPFDAGLGRGPRGELTAVYSRCRVEPRTDPVDGLPVPATGRGCDVYRYDTRSGRERRVPVAARPGRSEFLPSIDGSRLAFAVRAAKGAVTLHAADLATGRASRLSAGAGRLGPRSLDVRGRRVAVALDDRLGDGRLRSRVRLVVIGGRARTLASVAGRNGMRRLRSLGFNGDVLSWVGHHLPGLGPRVAVRHDLGDGSRRILVLPDGATAYVPWTVERGVPLPHVGVYGRIVPGGWGLRAAMVLPELLLSR